ncbi:hypothetical protein HDU78_000795 [Chytriomyces hyalinus]|nr:hypothetical protein HDU78_000795 [Chytriomyces hyalinus]
MTQMQLTRVLTVAGSDSGGGAGIQADLKTVTSLGCYGSSAVTALTAQNTIGVQGVHGCPAGFVQQQMESVLTDIGTDAIKTGMLFSREIVEVVANQISQFGVKNVVVDPVMVATSGDTLLASEAVNAVIKFLLPLATVLTPNVPEAEVLCAALHGLKKSEAGKAETTPGTSDTDVAGNSAGKIESVADMRRAARFLHSAGAQSVLIKGGHLPLKADAASDTSEVGVRTVRLVSSATSDPTGLSVVDVLFDGAEFVEFWKPFVNTSNTHGTGCTLSAAIAAYLASGKPVVEAVEGGLIYVSNAISTSISIGKGHGPLNHLHLMKPALAPANKANFVSMLKNSCVSEWEQYIDHKFVRGLADGTLDTESFKYYIRQDYIYLLHYARGYALAAFKEQTMEGIAQAAQIALGIVREATDVHVKYCESWGISHKELIATKEATANMSYTRFFLEKGMSGDRLDLYVAMAPCLIGYGEIGLKLMNDPNTKREGNPYWAWIQNYGEADFQAAVQAGEELLERLYEETVPVSNTVRLEQLCENFRQATLLEVKFWDMGLNREQ